MTDDEENLLQDLGDHQNCVSLPLPYSKNSTQFQNRVLEENINTLNSNFKFSQNDLSAINQKKIKPFQVDITQLEEDSKDWEDFYYNNFPHSNQQNYPLALRSLPVSNKHSFEIENQYQYYPKNRCDNKLNQYGSASKITDSDSNMSFHLHEKNFSETSKRQLRKSLPFQEVQQEKQIKKIEQRIEVENLVRKGRSASSILQEINKQQNQKLFLGESNMNGHGDCIYRLSSIYFKKMLQIIIQNNYFEQAEIRQDNEGIINDLQYQINQLNYITQSQNSYIEMLQMLLIDYEKNYNQQQVQNQELKFQLNFLQQQQEQLLNNHQISILKSNKINQETQTTLIEDSLFISQSQSKQRSQIECMQESSISQFDPELNFQFNNQSLNSIQQQMNKMLQKYQASKQLIKEQQKEILKLKGDMKSSLRFSKEFKEKENKTLNQLISDNNLVQDINLKNSQLLIEKEEMKQINQLIDLKQQSHNQQGQNINSQLAQKKIDQLDYVTNFINQKLEVLNKLSLKDQIIILVQSYQMNQQSNVTKMSELSQQKELNQIIYSIDKQDILSYNDFQRNLNNNVDYNYQSMFLTQLRQSFQQYKNQIQKQENPIKIFNQMMGMINQMQENYFLNDINQVPKCQRKIFTNEIEIFIDELFKTIQGELYFRVKQQILQNMN